MEDAVTYDYAPPVAQLLTIGRPDVVSEKEWPDYLALGLHVEDIPELIRLVTDKRLHRMEDEDPPEVYAPYHAWRALGQLRAEAAIEPLLSLFELEDVGEWVMEEVPEVYGMIGVAALPALTAFVADASHSEEARTYAVLGIEMIGKTSPEARLTCIEILSKQLESFQKEEYDLNATLILSLIQLDAKESAPLMERAFAAGAVDPFLIGDWKDTQEALGLLSPEELAEIHQRKEAEESKARQEFTKAQLVECYLEWQHIARGGRDRDHCVPIAISGKIQSG